ncbi:MAG: hypothetical protein IKT00_05325 [Prevotella sp.]|nr:hypothetical protein [Prevotella sp.]
MPFQKGHKKISGRKPGSKNRVTSFGHEMIAHLLDHYQSTGQMAEDFLSLSPKDRLLIAERLAQYIIPKQQAVSADYYVSDNRSTITDTLIRLSELNDV